MASAPRPPEPFFQALCRTGRALLDMPAAAVRLREGTTDWSDVAQAGTWADLPWSMDGGPAAYWVADARSEPAWSTLPGVRGAPGLRCIAGIALGPGRRGALQLCDTQARPASEAALQRLRDLGLLAERFLAQRDDAARAARHEAMFRLLAESSTDTIVRADTQAVRLYISPSVRTLLGYEPDELIGERAIDLTHPEDAPRFRALLQRMGGGGEEVGEIEVRQRHRDGRWIWIEAHVRRTHDPATGAHDGYVTSVRNIERRKQMEARLDRMASYDAMTELPNRGLFERRLQEALARLRRGGPPLGLLYMDLDGFKQVNDRLGHRAGDLVLQRAAQRMRAMARTEDVLARMGGDEFTALVLGGTEEARQLSERLIAAIERPFRIGPWEAGIGLSIGIACAPQHARTPEELMARADLALYAAKAAGRRTYRFHAPESAP